MDDAIEIVNELIARLDYGDITKDQVVGKLQELKTYLEV